LNFISFHAVRPCPQESKKVRPGPAVLLHWDRGSSLGVMVMMVVVVMMVMRGGECRGGKHHQKQGGSENLFHGTNVARSAQQGKWIQECASKEALGLGNRSGAGQATWLNWAGSA